jgi:hypothetical protein
MSTIDDKKNGRQPIVFGDVKAFLKETITHIVYVVLWGIGGAFFFTLVQSVNTMYKGHSMADIILPTDLDKPPYIVMDKQQMNLTDVIQSKGIDKIRAILEWIYPMDHPSFPYNLDTPITSNGSNIISNLWNNYIHWLVNSCRFTFSMYRGIYKGILTFFYIILNSWKDSPILNQILSTLMFYVSPILVLLISFVPWMVPVGFFLALAGTVFGKNSLYNICWLIAPLTVFVVGILELIKSPSFFFSGTLWVIFIAAYLLSWGVFPIALLCFGLIGVALWIYAIFFFICAPLTQEGGLSRIKETIGLHWKGLTILFLGLVTKSALIHLSSTLFTGVTVGVIISLFLLYRA